MRGEAFPHPSHLLLTAAATSSGLKPHTVHSAGNLWQGVGENAAPQHTGPAPKRQARWGLCSTGFCSSPPCLWFLVRQTGMWPWAWTYET